MKVNERIFAEIEFSESEKEILQQAEEILTRLYQVTRGKMLVDERTGECVFRKEILEAQELILKLSYHEFPQWLFEFKD